MPRQPKQQKPQPQPQQQAQPQQPVQAQPVQPALPQIPAPQPILPGPAGAMGVNPNPLMGGVGQTIGANTGAAVDPLSSLLFGG